MWGRRKMWGRHPDFTTCYSNGNVPRKIFSVRQWVIGDGRITRNVALAHGFLLISMWIGVEVGEKGLGPCRLWWKRWLHPLRRTLKCGGVKKMWGRRPWGPKCGDVIGVRGQSPSERTGCSARPGARRGRGVGEAAAGGGSPAAAPPADPQFSVSHAE